MENKTEATDWTGLKEHFKVQKPMQLTRHSLSRQSKWWKDKTVKNIYSA